MANGKGWIDCRDCQKCALDTNQSKFCTLHQQAIPDGKEIDFQHTVCANFIPTHAADSILNGEVVLNEDGATYHVYRRGSERHTAAEPQPMKSGTLYVVHYNEQVLRPYAELNT
ncbi:MAG: hypothetical protein ACWA5R_08980 [bacterium]